MVLPSLLAGLSALVLQKKQLQKLDSFQKKIWRRVFGLHKNAPINMILWISGMPSPTILWELQVLSLFWNVWTIPSPCRELCRKILENKPKGTYWINQVTHIMAKYEMAHPIVWLGSNPPTKSAWKNYCKERVMKINNNLMKAESWWIY